MADQDKELKNALQQIEKQFGKGSIMQLGDGATSLDVQGIPTGALSLGDAVQGGVHGLRHRAVDGHGFVPRDVDGVMADATVEADGRVVIARGEIAGA